MRAFMTVLSKTLLNLEDARRPRSQSPYRTGAQARAEVEAVNLKGMRPSGAAEFPQAARGTDSSLLKIDGGGRSAGNTMRTLDGARRWRCFCPVATDLEQKVLPGRRRHGNMQGVGDPAERADIVRIGSFLTNEAVRGGGGEQFGSAMDVDRRMHKEVQENEER
jgi:hypothetical protein